MKASIVAPPSTPAVLKMKKEGVTLLRPLRDEVDSLTVTTAEEYEAADNLLARIAQARKTWKAKLSPIIDPLNDALKAAKKAMDGAKTLHKEADEPLEQLELTVRGQMKAFKLEEHRQLQEAQREQERLQAALQEQLEREATARTAQQRAKATVQREVLEQRVEQAVEAAPAAVYVENSSTRVSRKVRVSSLRDLLQGILDGYVPEDCVEVRMPRVNAYFKEHGEAMASWPGVVVEDDVTIVRR